MHAGFIELWSSQRRCTLKNLKIRFMNFVFNLKCRYGVTYVVGLFLLLSIFVATVGVSETYAATISVPTDYSTIQAAINAANNGDVVNIANGTYNEDLIINKEVSLKGASEVGVVVINPMLATSYGISVTADNVNLEKMTVKNGALDDSVSRFNIKVSHLSNFSISEVTMIGNGKSYGLITGLDFNSVSNISVFDTSITGYSKNGIALTGRYAPGDGASSNISFDSISVIANGKSDGWAGIAFYTLGSLGGNGDITGVTFAGNNLISGNPMGVYFEGHGGSIFGFSGNDLNLGFTEFSGNTVASIVNGQVADVEAFDVIFSGATDGFDIEDRVFHAIDAPGFGLVSWELSNAYVTPNSFALLVGTTKASIQRAIDAVSGGAVNIAPGLYEEQLVINKNLNLVGSGVGSTVLNQPSSLVGDVSGSKNLITVTGNIDTEITALSLTGDGSGLGVGIYVRDGANANIHDNAITTIGSGGGSLGILVGRAAHSTFGTAIISNNNISGYGKGGIVVDNSDSSANITGNTVIGGGDDLVVAQNGIQISRGATGMILNNIISGHVCTNTGGGCTDDPTVSLTADGASGVLLYASGNSVEVANNTLSGNQFNIWTVGAEHINVHDNDVIGAFGVGIAVWDSDQWTGILGFTEVATAGSILNNNIENHGYGLLVRDYTSGGALPMVEAHDNDILENSIFGAWSNTAFNAKDNFWGSCSGPFNATLNPNGKGNKVKNKVTFTPWEVPCLSSISGQKFHDLDGNGAKDLEEPGLEGWKVRLKDMNSGVNSIIATTFTDVNGNYEFKGLDAGDYRLTEKQKVGWTQVYPVSPKRHSVTLDTNDSELSDLDFGNFELITVRGFKYNDLDGSGSRDLNEPGLPDWTINISGPNGFVTSTVTDIDGAYKFVDLGPGSYSVSESQMAGWVQTEPSAGGNWSFPAVGGQSKENLNFGNQQTSSINAFKYEDMEADGDFNNDDQLIEGWGINLYDDLNTLIGSTTTDANGLAWFMNLPEGTYKVEEISQFGWLASTATSYEVILDGAAGTELVEFGNYQLGTIRGKKFQDDDRDGSRVSPEPWLEGWEIGLYDSIGLVATSTTDINGLYIFDGLEPGSYEVFEVQQVGWTQTAPINGFHAVTLRSGQVKSGRHFGNQPQTIISGFKYEDVNANGTRDVDPESGEFTEPGLEGWNIIATAQIEEFDVDSSSAMGVTSSSLIMGEKYMIHVSGTYEAGDSITADAKYSVRTPNTTWTDMVQNYESYGAELLDLQVDGVSLEWGGFNADHEYWVPFIGDGSTHTFTVNDLYYPGNLGALHVTIYRVAAEASTNSEGLYVLEGLSAGNFEVMEEMQAGWIQTSLPYHYDVSISSGEHVSDINFGNFKLAEVHGVKYEDINGDGRYSDSEPLLPGWTIRLLDESYNLIKEVVTDTNGKYSFLNLTSGMYFIDEEMQAGWEQSQPGVENGSEYELLVDQSGLVKNDENFGNYRPAEIRGRKYQDSNFNGVRDVGEPGVKGWVITLKHLTSDVELVRTTNKNGVYKFKNIRPGSYLVKEETVSDWLPFSPPVVFVKVESNQVLSNVNFGNETIENYIKNGLGFGYTPATSGESFVLPEIQEQEQEVEGESEEAIPESGGENEEDGVIFTIPKPKLTREGFGVYTRFSLELEDEEKSIKHNPETFKTSINIYKEVKDKIEQKLGGDRFGFGSRR